jgi:hypothetical protein
MEPEVPAPEPVYVPVETPVSYEPEECADPEQNREDAIAAEISSLFTSEEYSMEPEPMSVDIPYSATAVAENTYYEEDDGFSLEGILDEEPIMDEDLLDDGFIEDVPDLKKPPRKVNRILKKFMIAAAVLMVLALLACGGMWYFQTQYMQRIDAIDIVSTMDQVTVRLDTQIPDSKLQVVCMDTYGNSMTESVTNGEAVFTGLLPNSQYKINVEISGFHKLVGKYTDFFNTAAQTNIVNLTAIAGPEDGSVLLSMVIDGTDPESWNLVYGSQGTEEQQLSFIGHSVTIKGLELGREYTFTIQNPEGVVLTGQTSVTFTSTELVMAENLRIVSCSGGNLTTCWDVPEGVQVDTWTVRCYNDADYEQVQENIIGTEATFTGVDTTRAYTVEVTAGGMTQPIRTNITSNPITVTAFTCNESDEGKLEVSWRHEGKEPVGGWLLMYQLDNSDKSNVVKCDSASASISPIIPDATYHFEIQAADSTSIFSNYQQYATSQVETFDFQGISGDKIVPQLLKTPEDQNWTYESISNDDFTDTFASGDFISVVLQGTVGFYIPEEEISALYVIRDQDGNVLSDLIMEETLNWKDLWFDGDPRRGELDLPVAPAEAGTYTIEIYFNSKFLTSTTFTIQ